MKAEEKQDLKSSVEIGRLFDMTDRRVQQLAKEGIIPVVSTRPYRFDLCETVQAYVKYLSDLANTRKAERKTTEEATKDKLRAEANLKQSKAKIEELKLMELEGKMHRSEDVQAVMNDLVFTIRSMILALPGRLAMDAAKAQDAMEASAVIHAECCKILEELSHYRYDPDEYRKRVRERERWKVPTADETAG